MKNTYSPIQYNLYNANYQLKHVKFYSDDNEKHCGRVEINKTDEIIDLDNLNVSLIRLQYSKPTCDFLIRDFKMFGKTVNVSRFFSPYQFQSGIIDIPCGGKYKDLKIEVPLKFMEYCVVTVFLGESSAISLDKIFKDEEAYVNVTNNTDSEIEVDLIELCRGVIDEKYKLGDNKYSISLGINKFNVKSNNLIKIIRILSENTRSIHKDLTVENDNIKNEIKPIIYLSANQYQSCIVEIPFSKVEKLKYKNNDIFGNSILNNNIGDNEDYSKKIEINEQTKVMVKILPRTTVFYDFVV